MHATGCTTGILLIVSFNWIQYLVTSHPYTSRTRQFQETFLLASHIYEIS